MNSSKDRTDWQRVRSIREGDPIPYDPEDGPYDPNDEAEGPALSFQGRTNNELAARVLTALQIYRERDIAIRHHVPSNAVEPLPLDTRNLHAY